VISIQSQSLGTAFINAEITNKTSLDSIVIYDKENSWKIKSSLKFKNGNIEFDTLNGIENKIYSVYIFINGKQNELGKIEMSPNHTFSFQLDERMPHTSIRYSGHHANINNFMAFISKQQFQLSQTLDDTITQDSLELLINEKKALIIEQSSKFKVTESVLNSNLLDYDNFCKTLLQKNQKYQYKNSLSGLVGNQFTFKDKNGKNVSLDNFLGKYIYIDVWATWCKPCREEFPFLDSLKKHFKDENALQIISVSVDKDFPKWSKFVTENNMNGFQLHAASNSDFVKFYDIGALPRYILIDKNGNVMNPSEMRPSEPSLIKKIEDTIKDL
jgi:thiol-disulfide isomerase/thioredoxin